MKLEILIAAILQDVPAKSECDIYIARQIHESLFAFGPNRKCIRLCDNSHRPSALGIYFSRQIQHDLIGIVVLRRNHGQDNASPVDHIFVHYALHNLNIRSGLQFVL